MPSSAVAALTAAAMIALATTPATAQPLQWDPASSRMPFADAFSSEEPLKSLGQGAFTVIGSAVWTPLILSTMASSLLGPQCNLFDTRGC